MVDTSIECDWNPVAGCSILMAGCTSCSATKRVSRHGAKGVENIVGLYGSPATERMDGKIRLDHTSLDISRTGTNHEIIRLLGVRPISIRGFGRFSAIFGAATATAQSHCRP